MSSETELKVRECLVVAGLELNDAIEVDCVGLD
jgi:hypothetical protein